MAMIFDRFPTSAHAIGFAASVSRSLGLDTATFSTVEASDAADPFPFELVPPIVHVDRTDERVEAELEGFVAIFGGRFAGT
jgi:hypothetical protein